MNYPLDWKLASIVFRAFIKYYSGLENLSPGGPYIFVANHIGLIDSPFIVSVLMKKLNHRIHFLAKEKLIRQYGSFVSNFIFQTISVNKKIPSLSLEEAEQRLLKGESVALFPEGKRNANQRLFKGKTGAARLALKTRAPLIPIGYQGPVPNSLQENFWKDFKDLFSQHRPVIIKIGKPVNLDKYYSQPITYELLQIVTGKIMQAIGPLCNKRYLYQEP